MGDPKKQKKTYSKPGHPWQKARIEDEQSLLSDFGLKNKREIYKHTSFIKAMINHYKHLNNLTTGQAEIEMEQMLQKAKRLGLLSNEKELSAILDLKVRDILERRLQTIVFRKGLARSPKQARQFIVHRHIMVNGRVVDAPSYIVPLAEEAVITFVARSAMADENHPERSIQKPAEEEQPKEEKKKDDFAGDPDAPIAEEPKEEEIAPVEIKDEDDEPEAEEPKEEKK